MNSIAQLFRHNKLLPSGIEFGVIKPVTRTMVDTWIRGITYQFPITNVNGVYDCPNYLLDS